jgi:spermidine/putrescine transport system ATP-binding protein
MNSFAVELLDVTKHFPSPGGGEVIAVDHVQMQIQHGEFFSMLGPSGCGKTTSLRMIAGFEWPTSGEVIINGKPAGHTPPFQRPVNTVFQSFALFQHMSVFENVAFGLEMEKVPKSEIQDRVKAALAMVQLSGMENRKPKQLSGGQQQRVALARALIKRPAVLLLDEPLGALDLKLRKDMQLELKLLQIQVGITFIYVTHDQEEALTMSDRIAVMDKGRVLQMGNPIEIYERPNCRFVADFIGDTNFLTGTVKELDSRFAKIFSPDLNLEIYGIPLGEIRVGQPVIASIRPEKIHLDDQPGDGLNYFQAKVINTAYIGSDTRVNVAAGIGVIFKIWEQNRLSTIDPKAFYKNGEQVWVQLVPENTLILPGDN